MNTIEGDSYQLISFIISDTDITINEIKNKIPNTIIINIKSQYYESIKELLERDNQIEHVNTDSVFTTIFANLQKLIKNEII
jgi:hypothetical protein